MKISYEEFDKSLRKVSEKRIHKSTNTLWSKFIIRDILRTKEDINIHEDTYNQIIRRIFQLLSDELFEYGYIKFPCNMGEIYIKKTIHKVYKDSEGKIVRTNAIDWNTTKKLWYERPDCYNKKLLIKYTNKETFKPVYRHGRGFKFKNYQYYKYSPSRVLHHRITELIRNYKYIPSYE